MNISKEYLELKEALRAVKDAVGQLPPLVAALPGTDEVVGKHHSVLSISVAENGAIWVSECIDALKAVRLQLNEICINILYNHSDRDWLISRDKEYPSKQATVKEINQLLRLYGASIAHPETGEPCIVYALPTRNGKGRYTLESRITKKRSGSYPSIFYLTPFKLVEDVPMKIGSLEARKKG